MKRLHDRKAPEFAALEVRVSVEILINGQTRASADDQRRVSHYESMTELAWTLFEAGFYTFGEAMFNAWRALVGFAVELGDADRGNEPA